MDIYKSNKKLILEIGQLKEYYIIIFFIEKLRRKSALETSSRPLLDFNKEPERTNPSKKLYCE